MVRYAVACLEREAEVMLQQCQFFLLPSAAFSGSHEMLDGLQDRAARMLGRQPPPRTAGGQDPLVAGRIAEATRRMNSALAADDLESVERIERELNEWLAEHRALTRRAQQAAGYWQGDTRELAGVRHWMNGM